MWDDEAPPAEQANAMTALSLLTNSAFRPELLARVAEEVEGVQNAILEATQSRSDMVERVVRHTLSGGGKRLRPAFVMLAARAIENTVNVVAVGQGGERYVGHSLVADARGSIVDEAHSGPVTLRATLDDADVARVREINPSLANRRIRSTS